MENNNTVFEAKTEQEEQPPKEVASGVVPAPGKAKPADFLKGLQIKLKDPKTKLAVIAGAIVLVVITILTLVLIIISLIVPKNTAKVSTGTDGQATPIPIVQDPKAEEQQKLKEEVQNFDLQERPLLPPSIEFDIEF